MWLRDASDALSCICLTMPVLSPMIGDGRGTLDSSTGHTDQSDNLREGILVRGDHPNS